VSAAQLKFKLLVLDLPLLVSAYLVKEDTLGNVGHDPLDFLLQGREGVGFHALVNLLESVLVAVALLGKCISFALVKALLDEASEAGRVLTDELLEVVLDLQPEVCGEGAGILIRLPVRGFVIARGNVRERIAQLAVLDREAEGAGPMVERLAQLV